MNTYRFTCPFTMRRPLVLACSVIALTALPASNAAAHSQDKDCADFATQRAAQDHQDTHVGDPDHLDDDDGVTCPGLPCPCGPTPLPPAAPIAVRAPSAVPLGPLRTTARVHRVIDATTLTVRLPAGETVNVGLIGIDRPPQARRPRSRGRCGAPDATARITELAFVNGAGRIVTLQTDPTHDRAGPADRRLAYVSARGVDFGRTMLASGVAKLRVFEHSFVRLTSYRQAQASAKAAKRGVWRRCAS